MAKSLLFHGVTGFTEQEKPRKGLRGRGKKADEAKKQLVSRSLLFQRWSITMYLSNFKSLSSFY